MKLFKIIIKGNGESGFDIPNSKLNSFTRSPKSIRKATLSPSERRVVSNLLRLFNRSNLRRTIPGIKVR